jgi:hypothetical protein
VLTSVFGKPDPEAEARQLEAVIVDESATQQRRDEAMASYLRLDPGVRRIAYVPNQETRAEIARRGTPLDPRDEGQCEIAERARAEASFMFPHLFAAPGAPKVQASRPIEPLFNEAEARAKLANCLAAIETQCVDLSRIMRFETKAVEAERRQQAAQDALTELDRLHGEAWSKWLEDVNQEQPEANTQQRAEALLEMQQASSHASAARAASDRLRPDYDNGFTRLRDLESDRDRLVRDVLAVWLHQTVQQHRELKEQLHITGSRIYQLKDLVGLGTYTVEAALAQDIDTNEKQRQLRDVDQAERRRTRAVAAALTANAHASFEDRHE